MLVNIGGKLFALVPAQSLEAGPEFFNAGFAPHNCVGGSEQGCVPGDVEARFLYKDPSKMNLPVSLGEISNMSYVMTFSLACYVISMKFPFLRC